MSELELRQALGRAKEIAGGPVALSRLIGVSSQAVGQWKRIPAERVQAVSRVTGIPAHELRPDVFGEPPATTHGGEAA